MQQLLGLAKYAASIISSKTVKFKTRWKSSRRDEFHAFLEDNQIVSLGHIFEGLTTVN
jgi:hypothetical protein